MNICNSYKPEYLNELETEYETISDFLTNSNKELVVNGNNNSGRTTIVKLYMKIYNYDYLLIDNYNLTKDKIVEKLSNITMGINRFFMNKKFVIVFDNYDDFDIKSREYILSYNKIKKIIIANKLFSLKNYIKIQNYSFDYLINLYQNIFFLETGKCEIINDIHFENINQMFSILELKILDTKTNNNSKGTEKKGTEKKGTEKKGTEKKGTEKKVTKNNSTDYFNLYHDKFDYKFNDLVTEKDFNKKLYILDKIHNYYVLQNNLIYNFNNIDDLADSYEHLSLSLEICNNNNYSELNDYYSILSTIGTTQKINDTFKVVRETTQIKKKKTFNDLHFIKQ